MSDFCLHNGDVHVWHASLDVPARHISVLHRYLAADERTRAQRFRFARDERRFIAARGMLRVLLAHYLQRDPAQLQFCYGPRGKPDVARESGGDAIRFNLSHSQDLALVAVTRGREVGVDLEFIRPNLVPEHIAGRFFAPEEVAALAALPSSLRREAFFACWTRKEAYLKARGDGLSLPLDHFTVSLTPGEPAVLLGVRGDPDEASRWTVQSISPRPGYIGALVVKGAIGRCICRPVEWCAEQLA